MKCAGIYKNWLRNRTLPHCKSANLDMKRRFFLKQSASAALALPLAAVAGDVPDIGPHLNHPAFDALARLSPDEAALADELWDEIRQQYNLNPDFLNLESGYCNTLSNMVLESLLSQARVNNMAITRYMRTQMEMDRSRTKERLATLMGVDPNLIAITRNTTESLNILISGIDLKKDDEIILSRQDYGSMVEAFEQKARRTGTVNKFVKIPLLPKDKKEIIAVYEKAITPKTKVMLVTHMINITGQIMPVKELCALGRKHGIEVFVDGAHAFAHIDFSLQELDCDYYATSLHKWLGAPLGNGLLFVKPEKIERIWPLMGDTAKGSNDIRKFEHLGTMMPAVWQGINMAIDQHMRISGKVKESRLRYLKNYWVEKCKTIPGFTLLTPTGDTQSCGIATFTLEGRQADAIARTLMEKEVFTVAINNEEVKGVRVTPNVFTSTDDLDRLVKALTETASELPAEVLPGQTPQLPAPPAKNAPAKKK